jgi:hypothetical protein
LITSSINSLSIALFVAGRGHPWSVTEISDFIDSVISTFISCFTPLYLSGWIVSVKAGPCALLLISTSESLAIILLIIYKWQHMHNQVCFVLFFCVWYLLHKATYSRCQRLTHHFSAYRR